nr:uncharacterized protein LOC112292211 isoform X3 [Physcomitrium patens]|eukprot:XP_024396243.1 uncharacterized protein LOC112292211 isoform X3 [Physcomitrella patens]
MPHNTNRGRQCTNRAETSATSLGLTITTSLDGVCQLVGCRVCSLVLIVWWRGERKRRRRRSCSSSRLIGMGSSNFQHGSREELNLFQPLFETRQRLQFLSSEIRLQAPNPPTIGGSKPENKVLILETQDDCGSDTAVASLLNNSTASFSFHTAAPTVEDSVDGNDVEPDGGTQHEQPPDNEHTHLGNKKLHAVLCRLNAAKSI